MPYLEKFFCGAVDKVINMPEVLGRITKTVLNNPRLVAPVPIIVKYKERRLTEEQAMIDAICRQLVEADTKSEQDVSVIVPEQSEHTSTNISDDVNTNGHAYSQAWLRSSSDKNDKQPRRVTKGNNQRTK